MPGGMNGHRAWGRKEIGTTIRPHPPVFCSNQRLQRVVPKRRRKNRFADFWRKPRFPSLNPALESFIREKGLFERRPQRERGMTGEPALLPFRACGAGPETVRE